MSYNYRIYGWRLKGGIDHIGNANTLESAYAMGNNLSAKEYYNYLLIQHDIEQDSDFPIDMVILERPKVKEKERDKR